MDRASKGDSAAPLLSTLLSNSVSKLFLKFQPFFRPFLTEVGSADVAALPAPIVSNSRLNENCFSRRSRRPDEDASFGRDERSATLATETINNLLNRFLKPCSFV